MEKDSLLGSFKMRPHLFYQQKQEQLWINAHVFYKECSLKHSHWNQGGSILPTEKNSSFRAILRNWDAQKYEDSLESYEYFLKVRFFFFLAHYFHTSNPTGCFCAHRTRTTISFWMRAGWLPRQNDTWVKCWKMHKNQAGWGCFCQAQGVKWAKHQRHKRTCARSRIWDWQTSLSLYASQT